MLMVLFSSSAFGRLQSACYPDPNDSDLMAELRAEFQREGLGDIGDMNSWPVGAIYLHGWDNILANGSNDELANREYLKRLSIEYAKKGLRIALPVAQESKRVRDGRTVLYWSPRVSLEESSLGTRQNSIEGLAKMACSRDGTGDDVELSHPRALMGYSNGGYKAINLVESMGCRGGYLAGHYTRVIAIGARTSRSRCNALHTDAVHSSATFSRRVTEYIDGWDTTAVWSSPRPILSNRDITQDR